VQINPCKKEEILYIKINEKYFKIQENYLTIVTVNLRSFNDILNIEINSGSDLAKFSLIVKKYLHEFFEGNTISG